MEVVLCEHNSILTEKKEADKKLVQMETFVCELEEGNLCQRNQIDSLEEKVQMKNNLGSVLLFVFCCSCISCLCGFSQVKGSHWMEKEEALAGKAGVSIRKDIQP